MSFKVGDIRSNLALGGARPTLFQVSLSSPFDAEMGRVAPFMCQATELPASSIGAVEVPYFGRKIRVAGDRTFEPWRVSVMNDEDFKVRHALEEWHNQINSMSGNLNTTGSSAPNNYKTDAEVWQFGKSDDTNPIRIYRMFGIFPTDIGGIELSWNSTNQIEMFNVTFSYDWFEVVGGSTGTIS